MEDSPRDIELIQKYLDRVASAAEKQELEYRLKEEPALQSLYIEHQKLILGIRYSHLANKLQQLKSLEAALPEAQPDSRNGMVVFFQERWKPLAVAAAICLVAVSWLLYDRPGDPAQLYAQYFEPYPNVFEPTQRGDIQQTDKRAEAFYSYERGEYTKAARLFEDLLTEKKEGEILLLLGNANLALNQDEAAKNNFLTLIRDFDDLDAQAKWFLSLCYLKQGELEKARMIWEELGDPRITYSEKAKKLLKEVK